MSQADNQQEAVSTSQSPVIEAQEFQSPQHPTENSGAVLSRHNEASLKRGSVIAKHGGSRASARWWHSQFNLMLAVFALLVLAALLFVALAPAPDLKQMTDINSTSPDSGLTPTSSEAPWQQGQLAQARTDSQAILAALLSSKKSLEEKDVQLWAPERFQQALADASEGDDFYKQQQFSEAVSRYQSAADQLSSLFSLLPEIISARLVAGENAINEGKSELAKELFNQILVFDPGNAEASAGLGRGNKLDQVLELLASANAAEINFEESGNLEELLAAEKTMLQAQNLDPRFEPVSDGLQRIRAALVEKRFKQAMSKAYQALFSNRYGAARIAFAQALKIKPGDATAAAAMQQSLASDKTSTLGTLLANAKAYESREEWASALNSFQTVLQRDPNQVAAKLGVIRSSARQQLDMQLSELLEDTLSIGRSERKSQASTVLSDARAINNRGPKLVRQIAQLESAMAQADTTIKVSLLSDALTDVSLQKVGSRAINLGQFQNKNLALKPGRYIARGVRLGYQDVRTEIELYPGSNNIQSITVRCDQPIKTSAMRFGS